MVDRKKYNERVAAAVRFFWRTKKSQLKGKY